MSQCPNLTSCPFFKEKLANMPAMTETYKKRYCMDNFENCARYIISQKLGKDKVPPNFFPNMQQEAMNLLKNQK